MRLSLIMGLIPALATGCSSTYAYNVPSNADRVEHAVSQPLHDLTLMRENPPAALLAAQAQPYRIADGATCETLSSEIEALDQILGPDVDAPPRPRQGGNLASLTVDALGGVVSLPYRGILRRVTGADRRDETLRAAILAGLARRSFLKGMAAGERCR